MHEPILSTEQQIVAAIRQIMRAVDLHSRRLFEACGLTGPQLAVLHTIERLAPVSPVAIAREVHLSQPTITGILQRLERQGLVARARSESDRRSVLIELTESGRSLLGRSPSLLQDSFRHELARLEEWERLMILANLQRIAKLMGAGDLDASPHLVADAHLTDEPASRDDPAA